MARGVINKQHDITRTNVKSVLWRQMVSLALEDRILFQPIICSVNYHPGEYIKQNNHVIFYGFYFRCEQWLWILGDIILEQTDDYLFICLYNLVFHWQIEAKLA